MLLYIGHGARHFAAPHGGQLPPADGDAPALGRQYLVQAAQKRALARAVVAHQGQAVPAAELKGDVLQRLLPAAVGEAHVLQLYHLPIRRHLRLLSRKIIIKNTGAPTKDVMAPMGSTTGDTAMRATMSLSSSSMLPASPEAGSRKR